MISASLNENFAVNFIIRRFAEAIILLFYCCFWVFSEQKNVVLV